MNKETKSFKVYIFDDEFKLISDESEQHLSHAAKMVDSLMREIAGPNARPDKQTIATLTALQLASQLLYSKNVFEKHQEKHKQDYQKLIERLDKELASLAE